MLKKTFKLLCLALSISTLFACNPNSQNSTGGVDSNNSSNPSGDKTSSENTDPTEGDVVTDLTIKTMPKTEYLEGDLFSPEGIVFDVVYQNGFKGDVDLDSSSLDDYSPKEPLKVTDTEASVFFSGFEKKIPITVTAREVKGLQVLNEPDIKSYNVDNKFNKFKARGLKIAVQYDNGNSEISSYKLKKADGSEIADGYEFTKADVNANNIFPVTVVYNNGVQDYTTTFNLTVFSGISLRPSEFVGKPAPEKPTDSYVTLENGGAATKDQSPSGDSYTGSIVVGTKMNFFFKANKDVQDAKLFFVVASTTYDNRDGTNKMIDIDLLKVFKITINGVPVTDKTDENGKSIYTILGHNYSWQGSGNFWTMWTDVQLPNITLKAGEFTNVTVECIGGNKPDGRDDAAAPVFVPNVDRMDVRF